jgi:hypothetical protein
MTIITHHLEAACPPERLWSVLSALTAVERYNPAVAAARIVGASSSGVGAMRECDLLPKGRVTEKVIVWEELRALGIEVAKSDWPITHMRWVTRVAPRGAGSTVDQRLEYGMKYGLAGRLLDALVMRRMIARSVGRALAGLIREAEARP